MDYFLKYLILPILFCTNDHQLIRIWMKDPSSASINGVTDDSLFLSVELDVPKLTSPDFKYAINDVVEAQSHKNIKREDDFRVYGNRHWNQQVFRYFPDTGLILSERFPDMALDIKTDYLELVDKKSLSENSKWKVKDTTFESLSRLRHSKIETEHFFIDHFIPNLSSTNNTHVTVDDIQPEFVNEITKSINKSENTNKTKRQNSLNEKMTEKNKENIKTKKNNTTLLIFISAVVILIMLGMFIKVGCFSTFKSTSREQDNLEERFSGNT